jgi:hypothetical protein
VNPRVVHNPKRDFKKIRVHRSLIEKLLVEMSNRVVTVRVSEFNSPKLCFLGDEKDEIRGIHPISSDKFYSPITGLQLDAEGTNII